MCQVGIRCYADSNAKLQAETKRLVEVDSKISDCRNDLSVAAKKNDFNAYSKARATLNELSGRRKKIVFERNSAQRDVDGTKKGQAILEDNMMKAHSFEEFENLNQRKNQGDATAFARAYSAKLKKSGKAPAIFLPGDKKPSKRVA